jgi:hypothetical protein
MSNMRRHLSQWWVFVSVSLFGGEQSGHLIDPAQPEWRMIYEET